MTQLVSLVLTILGPDRSGLVRGLAKTVAEHGGNWNESRMARLAGQFAGIVHISVPAGQLDTLSSALSNMEQNQLKIIMVRSDIVELNQGTLLELEITGHDRPGIIYDISHQLALLKVNIEEMTSEDRLAPMSNEPLFCATLKLSLPETVTAQQVQDQLESMADQLMVDVQFNRV